MSPIIELQRRLVEAGRIRAGDKGPKGEPRKITNWRLTSKDRQRLDLAAAKWGGEVRAWDGHEGEFELYTKTNQLPITLVPGQPPTTWYELWSAGGCQRRCDGVSLNSEEPCLCDPEERECKPYTRLSVLLPDLPGLGSWLLVSSGWNAAAELAGAADLLQRASAQGVLIPARLRLEQRVQITSGKTRRFAVPVIDIDVSFRELLGGNQGVPSSGRDALPSGYVPVANGANGPSLSEGLAAASEQQVASRTAPIPMADAEIPFGEPLEVPDEPEVPSPLAAPTAANQSASGSLKPTPGQRKKIGVHLKRLRDEQGRITTKQLWANLARARERDVDLMILGLDGEDDAGVLHFGPLLADLDRAEAARLIDWFERIEASPRDEVKPAEERER